jgi:hypothetical protein
MAKITRDATAKVAFVNLEYIPVIYIAFSSPIVPWWLGDAAEHGIERHFHAWPAAIANLRFPTSKETQPYLSRCFVLLTSTSVWGLGADELAYNWHHSHP